MSDKKVITADAQPTGMQPIADDLRAAAKAYRKGIYRDVSPDHLADTFDRIASSIEAAQPPAAPVETKPFYGAQCPTYPNCSGGCGLGCTHEVKQHQSCSAATEGCGTPGCTDPNCDYGKGPLRCQSCGAVVVGEPQQSAASEPVAYQFRQRSAVGKGPQSSLPWCDWICIERDDYERYLREPNKLVQVRPLYADVPQTFGNAVLETTSNMAAAVENLARHQEQCDMDGVMVKVSRQALDEVLSGVEAINSFACAVSRPLLLRDEGDKE